jgi:hypothetical protein
VPEVTFNVISRRAPEVDSDECEPRCIIPAVATCLLGAELALLQLNMGFELQSTLAFYARGALRCASTLSSCRAGATFQLPLCYPVVLFSEEICETGLVAQTVDVSRFIPASAIHMSCAEVSGTARACGLFSARDGHRMQSRGARPVLVLCVAVAAAQLATAQTCCA